MSEVDEKIARLVKQSYSYNGPNYYLNDMEAIACLTGYPLVFLASNPRIPVEIVEEKPELVIRQQADACLSDSRRSRAPREPPTRPY